MYVLISCGCAECHHEPSGFPLIEVTVHKTQDEAKAAAFYSDKEWKDHPQGGIRAIGGQGEDWVISLLDFLLIKNPKDGTRD